MIAFFLLIVQAPAVAAAGPLPSTRGTGRGRGRGRGRGGNRRASPAPTTRGRGRRRGRRGVAADSNTVVTAFTHPALLPSSTMATLLSSLSSAAFPSSAASSLASPQLAAQLGNSQFGAMFAPGSLQFPSSLPFAVGLPPVSMRPSAHMYNQEDDRSVFSSLFASASSSQAHPRVASAPVNHAPALSGLPPSVHRTTDSQRLAAHAEGETASEPSAAELLLSMLQEKYSHPTQPGYAQHQQELAWIQQVCPSAP